MTNATRSKIVRLGLPIGLASLLLLGQAVYDSEGPRSGAAFVDPDRDDAYLESSAGTMDWDEVAAWSPQQRVAAFRNHDRIYDTRTVHRGDHVFPLETRNAPLTGLRYRIWNFQRHAVLVPLYRNHDLDAFIRHNNVVGLLVIKSGEIVLETYVAGNSRETRWGSMSVTKSVLSMLVGAAVADGYIESTEDEVVDYFPALRGTSYESVTIGDLMHMSSGVEWNFDDEDPDWKAARGLTPEELAELLGSKPRYADPGQYFNYSDAEVNLLGAVLTTAVGEDLVTYLEEKIWQPFGMESDATWMTLGGGLQAGACCLSATLRDYGRLGLFALRGGRGLDGSTPLPKHWMERSTEPSAAASDYGFLWWLTAGDSYAAMGIYGQLIHIDPAEDLVIAIQSAWDASSGDDYHRHQSAFIEAVTAALR